MVKYTKYGDGGLTSFRNKEISKKAPQLDFIGELELLKANIKLTITNLDVYHYSNVAVILSKIVSNINNINADFTQKNEITKFRLEETKRLEDEITLINNEIKDYYNYRDISCKNASYFEVLAALTRKVERKYYLLEEEHNFQRYLNALSKYFTALSQYFDFINGI